jgi:hypothetical protein
MSPTTPPPRAIRSSSARSAALAVAPRARELLLHGGLKIDHGAHGAQQAAVLLAQHRAAAGGDHRAPAGGEIADRRCFTIAEAFLALDVEDPRDARARALLDQRIGVLEDHAELVGERATDGALAGPHGADEHHVPRRLHPGAVSRSAFR